MARKKNSLNSKAPSQRQQKVAEEVRHVLSDAFARGEFFFEGLEGLSVTIPEVKISVDFRHATVFATALGGEKTDELLEILKEHRTQLRTYLAQNMHLKVIPMLHFEKDTLFDKVQKLETAFRNPHVEQDLVEGA